MKFVAKGLFIAGLALEVREFQEKIAQCGCDK